jgi:exopolysaccharide biosynthesis predicted pyruvyltransferase EpsI
MNSKSKINELKTIIHEALKPIINQNYIYLDLPYHENIGDTLIWKGTEEFLKKMPFKCLYRSSYNTYKVPKIDKNVIVLLHGGGNFGDLYEAHNKFRLKIISQFPDNPIIILPQTVYYKRQEALHLHATEFGKHRNLTICARDHITLEILQKNFSKNKILLLPDMAFCIPESFLNQHKKVEENRNLYFKRSDIEFQDLNFQDFLKEVNGIDVDEHDWPTYEKITLEWKNYYRLLNIKSRFSKSRSFEKLITNVIDWYFLNIYFPKLLKIGTQFISPYKHVYTTRLHGAILSILLDKKVSFLDNSYGKNSNYYNSWLQDLDSIEMIGDMKTK